MEQDESSSLDTIRQKYLLRDCFAIASLIILEAY
jgi:hypothetical protein